MTLHCLGSGSSGNCYLLNGETETLVVEAGVRFADVKQALDFDISRIVGMVVSHEHGDHAGRLAEYLAAGIHAVAPKSVIEQQSAAGALYCIEARAREWLQLGGFSLYPIAVKHDVPCYAYIIQHRECGKLLFVTDTMSFPYAISGLNHIMIEADYDDATLDYSIDNGITAGAMRNRLYDTHLELRHTVEIIKRQPAEGLRTVTLLHLSRNNADGEAFRRHVEGCTGLPVFVAKRGLKLSLTQ